jgi:hypothetical protein
MGHHLPKTQVSLNLDQTIKFIVVRCRVLPQGVNPRINTTCYEPNYKK